MTDLASVQLIRSEALAALAADLANPKPDYSIDGQTVSRAQYRQSLMETVKWSFLQEQTLDPYELRGFAL